jgi:hypothetical protein
MRSPSDAAVVVGALVLAAFLAAQESHRDWSVTRSNSPGMVNLRIERRTATSRNSHSSDVLLADFHGLDLNRSGAARFEYIQDAGSFLCEGRVAFGRGSGAFSFQPNPKFADQLRDIGYDAPRQDQLLNMALLGVSLEFARSVRHAGVPASTGELIELRSHGVGLAYINEVRDAGLTRLTAGDLIQLKIHGVPTQFLNDLQQAGYDLPVERITELKIHGVDSRYIRDLRDFGLQPSASDIVQFKIQGVSPEFLKSLKEAGYGGLSANQIIELKIHGVPPEFIRETHDLGFDFSQKELIELQIHGVNTGYLRNLKASGMRNLTASQIAQLKIHGVE